jgi:hypothetical protein
MPVLATTIAFGGCRCMQEMATNTTSQILNRGKPALQQESDYELAARALPGSLKTIEAFHFTQPDNKILKRMLAEAYCQYGSGFVEDEIEVAWLEEKDFDKRDVIVKRAAKMFVRCMNYSLELLGKKWEKALLGDDIAVLQEIARKAGKKQRESMMWMTIGLASIINTTQAPDQVAYLPFAQYLLQRLVIMDGDRYVLEYETHLDPDTKKQVKKVYSVKEFGKPVAAPKDAMKRALPHFALGRLHNSRGEALGGNPEQGRRHFERAIELTDGKFLLAKVYFARDYCRMRQDRKLFHKTLVEVLQTNPAIWPEQRLANEIAHRRARRYLKLEKEWF